MDNSDLRRAGMLNVHSAALLALFATHHDPAKLRAAFSRYSETHFEVSDEYPEIGGEQQTWTEIFLHALSIQK